MAEIVRERNRLDQVFVEAKHPRQRARDLRHLKAVCQARAVMVAFVVDKNLRLVDQPAECGGVNDPVAVALIDIARGTRRFPVKAAAALLRMRSIRRQFRSCAPFPRLSQLTLTPEHPNL